MKLVIKCNLVSRLQNEAVSDLFDLILSAEDSCICLSHGFNPLMYQCVLGLSIKNRKIRRKITIAIIVTSALCILTKWILIFRQRFKKN